MSGRWAATREMAWRPSQPMVRCAGISTGPLGVLALDAGGDAVLLEEAGGFPTHAEGEGGIVGGFGGEEVEEVPLGHEGDEFCVDGEVGEVGDGELLAADVGGELVRFGSGGGLGICRGG